MKLAHLEALATHLPPRLARWAPQLRRCRFGGDGVFPRASAEKEVKGCPGESETPREGGLCPPHLAALSPEPPDFEGVLLVDNRPPVAMAAPALWMEAAAVPFARRRSALCVSVRRVVCVGPKEKVVRIHARGHVAAMTNEQPVRDWPSRKQPGGPVRAHDLPPVSEAPVGAAVGPCPQPTPRVGLGDTPRPKVILVVRNPGHPADILAMARSPQIGPEARRAL